MEKQNPQLDLVPDQNIPDPTVQSQDFENKFKKFLKRLALMDLEPELKKEIALRIKDDGIPDKLYWLEVVLAAFIATLGLLQNSVAVIIGAMLIAPFLRPLNALAWGIARWEKKIILIAAKTIVLSFILTVLIAWSASWVVSLKIETSEILARTRPNILDLFIAVFWALVAILSLRFSRLSESVAGVAIAAALLPPLSVIWIELYLGNYVLAFWSFMLFLTNILAIVFVGVVVFLLFGYTPHVEKQQKLMIRNFAFLGILIVAIALPLYASLVNFKEEIKLTNEVRAILNDMLSGTSILVDKINVQLIDKNKVAIQSTFKIPEGITFYRDFQQNLVEKLSKDLHRNVQLDLELIRIASIQSDRQDTSTQQLIREKLRKLLSQEMPEVDVVDLILEEIGNGSYLLKIILGVPPDKTLSQQKLKSIEEKIEQTFPQLTFKLIWAPFVEYRLTSESPQLSKQDQQKAEILGFLGDLKIDWVLVHNYNIDFSGNLLMVEIEVKANYKYPDGVKRWQEQVKKFLDEHFSGYILDVRVFPYLKLR